jgi:hypothetical protein
MRLAWVAAFTGAFFGSPRARADSPVDVEGPTGPQEVQGVLQPEGHGVEAAQIFANALLWPARLVVDLLFLTAGTAGALLENEQVVPRAKAFFFTQGGEIGVFPTFFLETGTNANVGARLIASVDPFAATIRAGYGGEHDNVVESRMRLGLPVSFPAVTSIEGMHDRRASLGFRGIGQTPESDGRNAFRGEPAPASFSERRERVVAGLGFRPFSDVEVLFSTSFTQRRQENAPFADEASAIANVFDESAVPERFRSTRIVYTELALRYDNRPYRRGSEHGWLVETYAGAARGVLDDPTSFMRVGVQATGFFRFIRPSTILSPSLVIDGLIPSGVPVPFREFVGQPLFRGFDDRRDYLSLVASLDYRWVLMQFVAARLFVDLARVLPGFQQFALTHVRWAAGFGFDLHSSSSDLGRIAVAGSTEGVNLLFSLGVPVRFGDRQHRE